MGHCLEHPDTIHGSYKLHCLILHGGRGQGAN
jgi:hypothetical protein